MLKDALLEFNPGFEKLNGSLYGTVYYFYRKELGLDADNISKPIWDCLQGIAYDDDKQIQFRIAAKNQVRENSLIIQEDLQNLPEAILSAFDEFFGDSNAQHLVYVELGKWKEHLMKFNWEQDAD